ncbi:MAG TPA: hypothetical protein VEP69_03565, partial [Thermodesulfovibrionales bacterium]|nr:hypothetical protein [Thermodesulfovibrionales bacterium]
DVERIDAIEIEPDVLAAGDLFDPVSRGALHDPKLKLHIDDARSYIVASQKRYDVIISEPSNPWISGIGNLFSREFFEMSRARLKQGGLFCQWVQLYGLNPDVLKMIIRTFSAVFPETAIWQSNPADILLVGSMDHFDEFDYQQFSNRLLKANPADLAAYLHIYDPMDFFSYFVAGRKNVEALSSDARFNTDDMPLLEFEAPFSLYASTEMQNNELLQKHMSIPEIRGYPGPEDVTKEYLFRKCLNFMKLDIPVDRAWRNALTPAASMYLSRRQNSLDENSPVRNASLLQALDYRPATLAPAYQDIDLVSSAVDIALKDRNRERALHYLEKAEAMPQHIISHSDLYYRGGMGLQAMGDMAGAERYLRRSVATNAYHARAVIALAELYREERRMPLACEAYRSAERLLNGAKRAEVREKMRSSCAP